MSYHRDFCCLDGVVHTGSGCGIGSYIFVGHCNMRRMGGAFKKIAYLLPFVHAVEMERAVLNGNFSDILPHFLWVLGYAVICLSAAILLFLRQMKKQ